MVLLKFIECVTQPSKTLQQRIHQEIRNIEEEFKMPYVASWEKKARKEGLQFGRQKGRQEGRQEGLQLGRQEGGLEARLDSARRMLLDGMSIENVKKYTGLTEKQIRVLIQ